MSSALCCCSAEKKIVAQQSVSAGSASSISITDQQIQDQLLSKAIDSYLAALTTEQIVSQLFIVGIEGLSIRDAHFSRFFTKDAPGGFLFFKYNVPDTPEQLICYTDQIFSWFTHDNNLIPPFLCIDHEGGYVNRLKKLVSPLPSAKSIAESLSPESARDLFFYTGQQLRSLGFHINLSPVTEIETVFNSNFLDTRSFGSYSKTIDYSSAAIQAYQEAGLISVVKHFPGNTNVDPHVGLPLLTDNSAIFNLQYLLPFKNVFLSKPMGVLLSHAVAPAIDAEFPSCLSKKIVTEMLKNTCNFQGLILSDDIFMAALAEHGFTPEKAAVKAVDAGVDMIMLSTKNYDAILPVLSSEYTSNLQVQNKIRHSVKKIIYYKYMTGLFCLSEDKTSLIYTSPDLLPVRLAGFYRAKQNAEKIYRQFF